MGILLLQWPECSYPPDPYPEPHGDGIRRWVLWEVISVPMNGIQFSSVQSLSRVLLVATPQIVARQASLSITNSRRSLRLTSIESVMPSSHLILCRPLLLLPPVPPSIRVFSNESILRMIGKQWKQRQTLFSWAPKSLQMVTAAMKLKDTCSLEEKL